jgi:hypothetical protein
MKLFAASSSVSLAALLAQSCAFTTATTQRPFRLYANVHKDSTREQAQSVEDPIYAPLNTNNNENALDQYHELHAASIQDPAKFWGKQAIELLDWTRPFQDVVLGSNSFDNVVWFPQGQLNVAYNAIDRHAMKTPDKVAMIWEGDEPDDVRHITYDELMRKVSQIANALKSQGVKKGDVVTIYMPMVPELSMTM